MNDKRSDRRSKLEIDMDILDAVNRGAVKPTNLMNRTRMAYKALEPRLKSLVKGGMLIEVNTGQAGKYRHIKYVTSARGETVLNLYKRLRRWMGEE
jgi:predicted transcriptional regulator